MVSIIIYTVLLFGLIVLFFVGTRFNRRPLQSGKSPGFMKIISSLVQTNRRLWSMPTAQNSGQRPKFVDEENPEVKKALRVLSDMYEEFQENIEAVREDLALTLAASHQQAEIRVRQLEARVARLEQQLCEAEGRGGDADAVANTDEPEVSAAGTSTRTVRDVSTASQPEGAQPEGVERVQSSLVSDESSLVSPEPGPGINGMYSDILNRLQTGASREEIARSLGVGLTEVDIVARIFLPTGYKQG